MPRLLSAIRKPAMIRGFAAVFPVTEPTELPPFVFLLRDEGKRGHGPSAVEPESVSGSSFGGFKSHQHRPSLVIRAIDVKIGRRFAVTINQVSLHPRRDLAAPLMYGPSVGREGHEGHAEDCRYENCHAAIHADLPYIAELT